MNLSNVASILADSGMSLSEKGIAAGKVILTGFVVVFAVLLLLIMIIKIKRISTANTTTNPVRITFAEAIPFSDKDIPASARTGVTLDKFIKRPPYLCITYRLIILYSPLFFNKKYRAIIILVI